MRSDPAESIQSYVKAPLSRRAFVGRIAGALGIGSGATYMATAPEDSPLGIRDPTGSRRRRTDPPLRLADFSVPVPAAISPVAIGRDGEPDTRLRKALDGLGGLRHFVAPGEIVLVKPNVAFDRAAILGATTGPEILASIIRMLLVDCRAQEVRVADNPIESPADCFHKSGVRQAVERAGGRVYLPDSNAFRVVETPGAALIGAWPVFHRPLTNVDKVIGVAPAKDHNLCGASIGIKNWYGLLGGQRNRFHQNIHEIVSDLALLMRPTLSIVDGSRVLMRGGPTGGDLGDVRGTDCVVAGVDPVAIDAWCHRHLLDRTSPLPEYLRRAEEKGSGRAELAGRVKEVS